MSDEIDSATGDTTEEQQTEATGSGTAPEALEIPGVGAQADAGELKDLDFILDIPLQITVELGRTSMLINDLLQLGQGSVVQLTKMAQEPMDIHVNGKLFARGEVVVVNEKFGVRLTDIISPLERVKTLG